MSLRSSAGVRDPRARGLEQRRIRRDLISNEQRYVAPTRSSAAKVGSIDEIADADRRAESVIGKNLEMRGEIRLREILLGHRPVGHVLEAEVAVRVDFARHYRFPGQIDVY